MNQKDKQTLIDPKDLFFAILKKSGLAMLVGIVIAGALFGYMFFSNSNDANILDASVRLDGESDVDYAERVKNINRAADIINSIDALNGQVANLREYTAESVLMQVNSENEAVTTAQLFITIEDSSMNGVDKALVSSYASDLTSGEYLANLATELGTKQGYLNELIRVEYAASNLTVVNTEGASGSTGTVTITVIGPTTDYTDKIMDCVLEEVDSIYLSLDATIVPHTIALAGRQSSYMVDNTTRDQQYNVAVRFEGIQKQITQYDESLNEVASNLGIKNKSSLYAYFSFNDNEWGSSPLGSALKFAIVGLFAGAFIVLCIVALDYLIGKKFSTQSQFYGRFSGVNKVGIAKPAGKRSAFARFIDKKTGDDNMLSDENSNKLIAANVKNMTSCMNKVLFTGTADNSKIRQLVHDLGIKADVKESFFSDPNGLEAISEYDGVIIVEQRSYSDCRLIEEELELIANADTKLVGAIVI